jgi:uncharacterized membrane protein YozB (DUF420 family)
MLEKFPWIGNLVHLNAALNALAFFLLLAGYAAIRRKKKKIHAACMCAAFLVSAGFLASYLVYHCNLPSRPYIGPWKPLYLVLLISHILLATLILPLVFRVFFLVYRRRFEAHRRFGRLALGIWLYVSLTGVLIYFLNFVCFVPES